MHGRSTSSRASTSCRLENGYDTSNRHLLPLSFSEATPANPKGCITAANRPSRCGSQHREFIDHIPGFMDSSYRPVAELYSLSLMPLHHLFDIATRYDGDLAFAVANDKPDFKVRGTAYIFDLTSKTQARKFPVRYEWPGWRVALSRDDRFCFAGCYDAYGLAAYSSATGEEVWRRKDLKSVQAVTSSAVEDWVFCGRETGAAHLLETTTGKTLEKLTGVKEVYPSPYDQSVIVGGRALELHAPFGSKLASFKRLNNCERPCAFSRSEFVLNEPDCLRCYDLRAQELLWSFEVTGDAAIACVWFCESLGSFLAKKTNSELLVFDARTGTLAREVKFAASMGIVFGVYGRGSRLLASNLQVLSTETGAVLADLATPELLAWDPQARMERFRELAASGRSLEDLERYMASEGFAKNDVERVLMMKYSNDRKKT